MYIYIDIETRTPTSDFDETHSSNTLGCVLALIGQ